MTHARLTSRLFLDLAFICTYTKKKSRTNETDRQQTLKPELLVHAYILLLASNTRDQLCAGLCGERCWEYCYVSLRYLFENLAKKLTQQFKSREFFFFFFVTSCLEFNWC